MELMKLDIQKFASSGTLGTLSGSYKTTYTVTWSLLSQDTATNTSKIRLTATFYTGNSTTISSSYSTFKLDGTTVYSGAYSFSGAGTKFTETKDITVTHNNDGSFPGRSVSFSTNDYIMGSQSGSGTISGVPSIARYPVLTSGQNFTDEENPTLTFTNPAKIYPIRVKLEAGGNNKLITRDIGTTATSYTFDLTEEERNKLRKLATTNSLTVTQTVCAMNGETELSSSYKNYTMTIVNANPDFNDFDFADINPTTVKLLEGDSVTSSQSVILGYSNVQVTIPVENKAIAQKEATMNLYRFNNIEEKYSETEDVSITSNNVTSGEFKVYAIDSRNNTKEQIKSASRAVIYTPLLKKQDLVAKRENGVSENVEISFSGVVDLVNFGAITNSIKTAQYRYKVASSNEWSEYNELMLTIDETGSFSFNNLIKGPTESLGFDINDAYNIEVCIEDELSQITYTANLGSGIPHIAYAKNGVGIMGTYDESVGGLFQVGGKKLNIPNVYNTYSNSQTDTYSCDYANKLNTYSTTEQRIGTWIDGKPLYTKTIMTNISYDQSLEILHGVSDYYYIWIDLGKSYYIANKTILPLISNSYWGDFTQKTDAMIYNDRILLYSTGSWGEAWYKVITLNYTKSTD